MAGVALFLWTPSKERKKEYILERLQEEFQKFGIETFQLDITSSEAFEELAEIDNYFLSVSSDKKRFVFSLDGDGFEMVLKMDGLWVDNIQYNVFTYLTKHPECFRQELAGINSWYISILNCVQSGVGYIEEKYPHLDGAEYIVFPAFQSRYSELKITERNYDVLLLADYTADGLINVVEKFNQTSINVIIYGRGWKNTETGRMESIRFIAEEERLFERKLELMGQSKIVLFIHSSPMETADIDIISAMAGGAVVFTEKVKEIADLFEDKNEIMLYDMNQQEELTDMIWELLKCPESLEKISDAGKSKARQIGDLSCFAEKIIERCK